MKRFQIYLDDKHLEIVQDYGEKHAVIAATGAKAGQVDKSRVIRMAIEMLNDLQKGKQ